MKRYLKEYEDGFNHLTILQEASRCLLCHDAPCSKECPAQTDPAKFIRSVRFKNYKGAAETIRLNNPLGGICARVCPTEKYCQKGCLRSGIDKPIDIGGIQRYVTDLEDLFGMEILKRGEFKNKTIAIVGSGPSGLSLAAILLTKGFDVTIYEKEAKLGGYLRYGIPSYRLPNSVLDKEISRIQKLGLKIKTNVQIGETITLNELKKEYDAVVLAIGYSKGKTLSLFENNPYVISAVDYLKEIKDNNGDIVVDDNILVVGGGDVAMDISTSLKMLGAVNVTVVAYEELYEFKASKKELENAKEMQVSIIDGYVPTEVRNNTVTFKHRRIPAELVISVDKIVLAVGQTYDLNGMDLKMNKNEIENNHYQISDNLFVVGDISYNKEKTVVGGVKSSKEASYYIEKYLGGK